MKRLFTALAIVLLFTPTTSVNARVTVSSAQGTAQSLWSSATFSEDDLPCSPPSSPAEFDLTNRRSADNAYLLMAASHVSYRFWPGRRERILKEWGFRKIQLFDDSSTSTNGFWAVHDAFVLMVFRGTQEPTDLLTDADVVLEPVAPVLGLPGRAHRGFLSSTRAVEGFTKAAADYAEKEKKPLILAGHSLGGAVAALSAAMLDKSQRKVHTVWSFGSPKIGDLEFSRATQKLLAERWQRLNQPSDPIPLLPFASAEQETLKQFAERYKPIAPYVEKFANNAAYDSSDERFTETQRRYVTKSSVSEFARGFWKHLPRSYVCDLAAGQLTVK